MPTPTSAREGAASNRLPFPRRVQLVSRFDEESDDRFYTGFSGGIAGGGVFVATYDLKPIGTPVEVELHLPNHGIALARGEVAWTREQNRRTPDVVPGMGIALAGLTPLAERLIDEQMAEREPLFWDRCSEAEPANAPLPAPTGTDDIAAVSVPPPEVFDADLRGETRFAAGMLRDVNALLATMPIPLASPSAPAPSRPIEPIAESLRVHVSRGARTGQFHGGFTGDDGPHRAFVATALSLPKGAPVRLVIRGASGAVVVVAGEVRWARRPNPLAPSCAAPPGLGIRLDDLAPAAWRELGGAPNAVLQCEEG